MKLIALSALLVLLSVDVVVGPRVLGSDCPSGYSCSERKDCAHGEFHIGLILDCVTPNECAHQCNQNDECKSFVMAEAADRQQCAYGGLCVKKSTSCSGDDLVDDDRYVYFEKQ